MDIKKTVLYIIIITVMTITSNGAAESGLVEISNYSSMPALIGDPMKIDALSALISTTGGNVNDMNLRRSGSFQFTKKLGPFKFMEVESRKKAKRLSLNKQHFTYGGEAFHVSATAMVSLASFELGVAALRDVRRVLFKEANMNEFKEKKRRMNLQSKVFAQIAMDGKSSCRCIKRMTVHISSGLI
ncbi:MAG: hypothetical protein J6T51_03185 [Kiritimatiellae bacterium]|nr:hypothetical protein [Kiritimatiellia bacterium]